MFNFSNHLLLHRSFFRFEFSWKTFHLVWRSEFFPVQRNLKLMAEAIPAHFTTHLDICFLIYCFHSMFLFFFHAFSSSFGQKKKPKKIAISFFVTNLHHCVCVFRVLNKKESKFVQGAAKFAERKWTHETISVNVTTNGWQGRWHNGSQSCFSATPTESNCIKCKYTNCGSSLCSTSKPNSFFD